MFYRWKRRFAGMGVAELCWLHGPEEENRKLKPLVTDLTLDKYQPAGGAPKNVLKPAQRRSLMHSQLLRPG